MVSSRRIPPSGSVADLDYPTWEFLRSIFPTRNSPLGLPSLSFRTAETRGGFHVKWPLLWSDFNQNRNVLTHFNATHQYNISWKSVQLFLSCCVRLCAVRISEWGIPSQAFRNIKGLIAWYPLRTFPKIKVFCYTPWRRLGGGGRRSSFYSSGSQPFYHRDPIFILG
jgi:hypothetical protein